MEDIRKKIVEMPENLPEIPKDMLQYAQKDEVLYDANPETISRGFFKDALVRLRKNKASIAAFWILCFIAFMAIFGPDMNEYTFSQQFSDYTNMPPRVQFLEDFGILMAAVWSPTAVWILWRIPRSSPPVPCWVIPTPMKSAALLW